MTESKSECVFVLGEQPAAARPSLLCMLLPCWPLRETAEGFVARLVAVGARAFSAAC